LAERAGQRVRIGEVSVDRLTAADALRRIEELLGDPAPSLCVFVNAHTVNVAARDPAFRDVLANASLVLNDGSGVGIAARLQGRAFPENLNGSDLMPRVLDLAAAHGWRTFLVGGRPGVAASAAEVMRRARPTLVICGTRDGHFPDDESEAVAAEIDGARTDLLLVGMGNPKQELWLARWLSATGASVGFGVGALFDFQAGRVRRAPAWMNRAGVEWAYRLAKEPRRLSRRYLLGNPAFLGRVFTDLARRRLTGRTH